MRESSIYPCNRSIAWVSQRLIESDDFSLDSQIMHAASSQPEGLGWPGSGFSRQPGTILYLWPVQKCVVRKTQSRGLPRYRLCLQSRQLVQWTHSQKSNLRLWREDATSRRTGCRPGTEGKSDRYTSVRGHASLWSTLHIAE